jgi:hypothetical protein
LGQNDKPDPKGKMHYLLLICSDGVPTPEKAAAMREHIPRWIEEMEARGVRKYGHELQHPSTAVTVRVRDGQTLLSDGPFAETKEFIGGFDMVECVDLDEAIEDGPFAETNEFVGGFDIIEGVSREEAIEIASKHPLARFHMVEVRPFVEHESGDE